LRFFWNSQTNDGYKKSGGFVAKTKKSKKQAATRKKTSKNKK